MSNPDKVYKYCDEGAAAMNAPVPEPPQAVEQVDAVAVLAKAKEQLRLIDFVGMCDSSACEYYEWIKSVMPPLVAICDSLLARVAELEKNIVTERQHSEWLQSECNEAVGAMEDANAALTLATERAEAAEAGNADLRQRLKLMGVDDIETDGRREMCITMKTYNAWLRKAGNERHVKELESLRSQLSAERQHLEWLQGECNKAVDAMEEANSQLSLARTNALGEAKERLSQLPDEYKKEWQASGDYGKKTIDDSWQVLNANIATAIEAIEGMEAGVSPALESAAEGMAQEVSE